MTALGTRSPSRTLRREAPSGAAGARRFDLTPGTVAALAVAAIGAVCLIGSPHWAWLTRWPDALTLPVTTWLGQGLTAVFESIKPPMRLLSDGLGHLLTWANLLLGSLPYGLTMGLVAALAWYLGGVRMAVPSLLGLGFVLCSGYWTASMNTLSLVLVSVPVAVVAGSLIGLAAVEVPRLNRPIQAALDMMQTVPTFAYLTPLLLVFGFGPVVGLIASVIYAAPPMARNLILGLQRVDPEIREAALMCGAGRCQQLFQVEIPSAAQQIMVGVNQTIMAALSMVIIAAVIGGFDDIGWAVLLTMRKAAFGESLVAGLVIVVFAILLDRLSGALARDDNRYSGRVALAIATAGVGAALIQTRWLPAADGLALLKPAQAAIDRGLGAFTSAHGARLAGIKTGAMYYVLLPLRIGLAQAVLPFTWGFKWTAGMSAAVIGAAALCGVLSALRGAPAFGTCLVIAAGVAVTGITNLPWPFLLAGVGALGWVAGGGKLAATATLLVAIVPVMGLWGPALQSLYLCAAAVLVCVALGGLVGAAAAVSAPVWRIVQPVCDMLQTIPLFVFLIPVLMFFQIGEFSAFLAICAYAIVPMIRYTREGLATTPAELVEAAVSSGATGWQIMRQVRAPYAAPTILLGLNQTILYAFSMLVIAALIGTTDLGQQIYLALGRANVGLGVGAGIAMAILALVADRLVQGFAEERKRALGL